MRNSCCDCGWPRSFNEPRKLFGGIHSKWVGGFGRSDWRHYHGIHETVVNAGIGCTGSLVNEKRPLRELAAGPLSSK
jgi:hypothetical protein